MKKNVLFVLLVLFGVMLSVDAAKKGVKGKKIGLASPTVPSSSGSDSDQSSEEGDEIDEKVELAEGFSIYTDLERNDLSIVRGALSTMLLKAAQDGDYKFIMDVKEKVDEVDPDNKHTIISRATVRQLAVKAYIGEEKVAGAREFLASLKTITVTKEADEYLVDECSKSGTADFHFHTVFYYQCRGGDLTFMRQQRIRVGDDPIYAIPVSIEHLALLLALMELNHDLNNQRRPSQTQGNPSGSQGRFSPCTIF